MASKKVGPGPGEGKAHRGSPTLWALAFAGFDRGQAPQRLGSGTGSLTSAEGKI